MKNRILTGWTIQRVFYLIAGVGLIVMSISDHQWIGALLGGYFAAMGIFSFGCASRNCCGGTCDTDTSVKIKEHQS